VCEQEVITISPDRLPGYAEKIKMFYEEHIHTDEEIRYILDGTGGVSLPQHSQKHPHMTCTYNGLHVCLLLLLGAARAVLQEDRKVDDHDFQCLCRPWHFHT
jgi:hypothetical protein